MADVLGFPAQTSLRLREVVGSNAIGIISAWLAKRPDARARFRIRIGKLSKIPRGHWTTHEFRQLGNGLAEIKWESGKVPHRVSGFDHEDHFVMLLGFTHKQRVYDPRDWLQTSKRRMKEVQRGERQTVLYRF